MSAGSSIVLAITLVAVVCLQVAVCSATSASFYGDSYIRLPMENAHSETDIKLHFRTHQSEGLLFLAAGSPDYCVVELRMGMVRVRTDLGSGEAALSSPPGIRFDDWKWHSLHLSRTQENLQLTIDGLYTTSTQTPGRFFELNINYGLFLGGMGSFTDIFIGNLGSYRGCLRQVLFNHLDVFLGAKDHIDSLNVYGVTWDCSSEFGATSDQAISFLHNTSFMALPTLPARREGRVSFDIRTRSEDALLIYNSGRLHSSDFVAVEMLHGNIKLTVNKGDGVVELMSTDKVNDGHWHQVEVLVELSGARVTVDGVTEERYRIGTNRFLDLQGYLFVGGINLQSRGKAISKGLQSLSGIYGAAGSLIGCLQNIKVNGLRQGFTEAQVTRGLAAECVWSYPCLSNPCIQDAVCIEEGFYTYRCVCDRSECRRHLSENLPPVPVNDVLAIQDVVVREGGRSMITSQNIDILFDYEALGLRESSIVFRVVNPPEQGQLQVNIGQLEQQSTFTLLDMHGGKVSYLHDGSEVLVDSIGLELEFYPTSLNTTNLPKKLRQKYGFTLIIKVAPWNDRPQILLPPDDTLVMVQNTDVRMTSKILNVLDKDDEAVNLEYTVQYPQVFDTGYFEISDSLGVRARIVSFTQDDVNEGRLKYIHRGALKADIKLQVSDRKDISDPKILHVKGVPLELRTVANHGIVITPGGGAIIFRDNLTFATNAPNQDIDIRYEITEPPFNGEVQRMQYADNQWTTVTTFSQRHIDTTRLRYIHSFPSHHTEDYFKFKVKALNEETPEYQFKISIIPSKVGVLYNKVLLLNGLRDERLTKYHLQANSSIPTHGQRVIKYTLVTTPQHGSLFRLDAARGHRMRKHKLAPGENFTQEHINEQQLMYRLHKALDSVIRDSFQFRISIPGDTSDLLTFNIKYTPTDTDIRFTNNGLDNVLEGESKVITRDELFLESRSYEEFHFTIIKSPEHGVLQLIDPISGRPTERNCTTFTDKDVKDGKLLYQHDDSEFEDDEFDFLATPVITQPDAMIQEIQEITGMFEVKIKLRNDNTPSQVVNKVFNVVSGRGRLLTGDDLLFEDADKDFDSDDLKYLWKGIQNGELVKAEDHEVQVTEFTQKELLEKKIYFQHHGANYGRASLTVTDSYNYITVPFEVKASEPYLFLANNTGLSVMRGDSVPILPGNLSISTNLDLEDKDVRFTVLIAPRHGRIKKNGMDKTKFHLGDLRAGQVVYEHDNSMNLQDTFHVAVRAEEMRQEAEVRVKVMLESHGNPPRLINSKMVMVDEKEAVHVTNEALKVGHPETPDGDIIFTITEHPKYGEIMLENGAQGNALRMFTQADVNAGLLSYTHTQLGHGSDVLKFDVTNGIQSLQGLELVFEIIPKVIPMDVTDIVVEEGASLPITSNIIVINNKHFMRDELIFFIVKQPHNGQIESTVEPGNRLVQFAWSQVNAESIYYVHDGNDTVSDNFSIMAKSVTSEKMSNPRTIFVTITPVNDQPPRVMVRKPLNVWTGSETVIGPETLKTEDLDTVPEELRYVISQPSNGDIVLKDSPQQNVVTFTQADINQGNVIFVHTGANEGEFQFEVTDGEMRDGASKTGKNSLHIHAQQLTLEIKVNQTLEVYPGIIQPISPLHLLAKTNDNNQTRPISFNLLSQPIHGKLVVRRNNISVEVDFFTQQDINTGVIYYQHYGEMNSWQLEDILPIEVATSYAQSLKTQLTVHISYGNINEENHAQLIKVGLPRVDEGGQIFINKHDLDVSSLRHRLQDSGLRNPDIFYVITNVPMHGILVINGENATVNMTMHQRDINRNNVLYIHDHSDSYYDFFTFALDIQVTGGLQGKTQGRSQHQNITLNITIIPVNDQPYELKTQNPGIELIQGYVKNITQEELLTVDPDTPPADILYEIKTPPNNGIIVYLDDPDRPIKDFTQKDVNDGRVLFLHDGSRVAGAFYFSVSDGQYKPLYKVFNIKVHPLNLKLVNTTDIVLIQGQMFKALSSDNFVLETNGAKSKVMYNITRPPAHGQMYMNDHPVVQFSHQNVEDGLVSYIQTDLSAHSDTFEFSVYDALNVIKEERINIAVKALVKTKRPNLPLGESLVVAVEYLDAGELASLYDSNPVYNVTQPPLHGKLYKVIFYREKRDARRGKKKKGKKPDDMDDDDDYDIADPREIETSSFTHQDVVDRTIKYKPVGQLDQPAIDRFAYLLSTPKTQPAQGVFYISLVSPDGSLVATTAKNAMTTVAAITEQPVAKEVKPTQERRTPPPIDPTKETAADHRVTMSKDHIVIVSIVCAITVVVIIGLICGRCIRAHREKQALAAAKEDSRTPLSQTSPPVETQQGPTTPVPVIVTPDFVEGEKERERVSERSRSPSPAPNSRHRSHSPYRYHTQPISYSAEDYRSSTPPPTRSPKLVHSAPMSKSQDTLKTEVSRTVPTCKVTPLFDGDTYGSLGRRISGSGTLKRGESNTGSLKRDQVTYDWDSVDPELLQHCRTTNPVLHENKYWV